jgi:competence protein ComGC
MNWGSITADFDGCIKLHMFFWLLGSILFFSFFFLPDVQGQQNMKKKGKTTTQTMGVRKIRQWKIRQQAENPSVENPSVSRKIRQ